MTETYVPEPTVVQVVLEELKKIPQAVLDGCEDGILDVEVALKEAVHKTLVVVESHMVLTYEESDLVPPPDHTGPDIQLVKVNYTEFVDGLSQLYWNSVNS